MKSQILNCKLNVNYDYIADMDKFNAEGLGKNKFPYWSVKWDIVRVLKSSADTMMTNTQYMITSGLPTHI